MPLCDAVLPHITVGRTTPGEKEELKAGYHANAKENVEIAVEWFSLEEDALGLIEA